MFLLICTSSGLMNVRRRTVYCSWSTHAEDINFYYFIYFFFLSLPKIYLLFFRFYTSGRSTAAWTPGSAARRSHNASRLLRHWRGTTMAAVGAPEVITQLESAAKVLMVRTSSLFSPGVGAVKHVRAVSGGLRRLEAVAVASLLAFFWGGKMLEFSVEKHRWAMRGASPRLPPSR